MSVRGRDAGAPATEAPPAAEGWRCVARRRELRAGQPFAVALDDARLVLVADRADGAAVVALADRCTHQSFPLSQGDVVDGTIMCAWHGARFDLATGACVAPPIGSDACGPVRTYDTRVVGDEVWVRLSGLGDLGSGIG